MQMQERLVRAFIVLLWEHRYSDFFFFTCFSFFIKFDDFTLIKKLPMTHFSWIFKFDNFTLIKKQPVLHGFYRR